MLRVTIELIPHGIETQAKTIGVVEIINDGTGNQQAGNYNVTASHAGKYFGRSGLFKKGSVKNFYRELSPYRLLSRALKAIGEV